jgi:hypothetical protein
VRSQCPAALMHSRLHDDLLRRLRVAERQEAHLRELLSRHSAFTDPTSQRTAAKLAADLARAQDDVARLRDALVAAPSAGRARAAR